uniref:ZMYM2-like/QRICH1 C-terminal domain-containing protein n=1 Tax=Amphimedon queenslandica TaxID=400682 RepID=A0A1X7ULR8_AMPQE
MPVHLKKKRRLSLSLGKGKQRFSVASSEELEHASNQICVPKNTTTAINWAFRLLSDWSEQSSYQPELLWTLRDPEKFLTMMSQFCLEVKQQNGRPYTLKSLLQILINLQNYARTKDEGALPLMSQKDEHFKRIHTVLDVSRELHKEGVGTEKVQARIVTNLEENLLWDMRVLGTLQNAVFFNCGLYLCSRGGDEHRELKYSQFYIDEVRNASDQTQMIKCLTYTEHGSKNRPGSIHQVHLENKIVSHYSKKELGEKCFVFLMELYLSKLSMKAVEKDLFYCKPAQSTSGGKPWYYDMPVGHNTLGR